MITIRTYWNFAEASLAKSVLDNYEIFCALFHENAHLYGRAPFAMPIRLVVDEDKADQALCILSDDLEGAASQVELSEKSGAFPIERRTPPEIINDNPWELLAIAFYFFLPGLCVLRTKYPALFSANWRVRREIAAVAVIHLLGWLTVAFAILLVAVYFFVRLSPAKVKSANDAEAAASGNGCSGS